MNIRRMLFFRLGKPFRNQSKPYHKYQAEKDERKRLSQKLEWLSKFPLNEMIKWGWIRGHKDKVDQLTELLTFFQVATWESWENVWIKNASFRKSSLFQSNPNARNPKTNNFFDLNKIANIIGQIF